MFRYTAILFSVLFIRPCSAQDEIGDVASDRETRRQADKELAKNVLAFTDDDGQLAVATTANQWQRRRRQIVSAMESVMGKLPDHPDRSPPAMTIIEEVDCGAYIRKKITYLSQPNCQTPAYLCVPKTVSEDPPQRFPAALCLHPTDNKVGHDVVVGLGGKPNRQYASELAARGYVTLAPSYPLLANYQPDLAELGWGSGTLKAIWDNQRGIDLLQSLPFVDDDLVFAIGHSLGGHNAVYTAVFDERIQAVVSSCGLDSYRDYYDGNPANWQPGKGWTQLRYMPRMADYRGRLEEIPFDFDQILAAIAPRSVLVIAPLHDSNFRADSVDRVVGEARKVFALYSQPQRLSVLHPDCDHDFPDPMRQRAYQLFDSVIDEMKGSTEPAR